MGFFAQLRELIVGYDLQLTIRNEGDEMMVMVVPKLTTSKNKDAQAQLIPLMIKGTAVEIDDNFKTYLTSALEPVRKLQVNIEEFEKSVEKAGSKVNKGKKPVEKPKTEKTLFDKTAEEKKEIEEKRNKPVEKPEAVVKAENPMTPDEAVKSEEKPQEAISNVKPTDPDKPYKPEEIKQESNNIPFEPDNTTASQAELNNDEFGDEDW